MPSIKTEFTLEGVEELEKTLDQFDMKLKSKMINTATRVAAGVIEKKSIAFAPYFKSKYFDKMSFVHLQNEITVRKVKKMSSGLIGQQSYEVAVKTENKQYADNPRNRRMKKVGKNFKVDGPGYYWICVTFGTKHIKHKNEFFKKAFDASKEDSIKKFTETLQKLIDKELDKK